jgi:hypothetical protein
MTAECRYRALMIGSMMLQPPLLSIGPRGLSLSISLRGNVGKRLVKSQATDDSYASRPQPMFKHNVLPAVHVSY